MNIIEAVFDGACEPKNPGGHAAFGSLVKVNGETIYRNSGYCGFGPAMSNNVAEYSGAVDALKVAVKYDGVITLRGDSRLVIMQLGPDKKWGGLWKVHGLTCDCPRGKCKRGIYVPHYEEAIEIVNANRSRMKFLWVPRDQNNDCDELSKQILIDKGIKFKIQPLEKAS